MGEFARSLWLFKSFPVGVIAKHWMRGWGQRTAGGKAAYLASYLVGSTVLGALAVQLKDLAKGREPREMDVPSFFKRRRSGLRHFYKAAALQSSVTSRSMTKAASAGVSPSPYSVLSVQRLGMCTISPWATFTKRRVASPPTPALRPCDSCSRTRRACRCGMHGPRSTI